MNSLLLLLLFLVFSESFSLSNYPRNTKFDLLLQKFHSVFIFCSDFLLFDLNCKKINQLKKSLVITNKEKKMG